MFRWWRRKKLLKIHSANSGWNQARANWNAANRRPFCSRFVWLLHCSARYEPGYSEGSAQRRTWAAYLFKVQKNCIYRMITIFKYRKKGQEPCDSCGFTETEKGRESTLIKIDCEPVKKSLALCNACFRNLAGAVEFISTTTADAIVKI